MQRKKKTSFFNSNMLLHSIDIIYIATSFMVRLNKNGENFAVRKLIEEP